MAQKTGPQGCPQCSVSALTARVFEGRRFCNVCSQELISCRECGAANLAWSDFCHNCGTPLRGLRVQAKNAVGASATHPSQVHHDTIPRFEAGVPQIERMRLCPSCGRAVGEGESYCSFCGTEQAIAHTEPMASLDPHTMKIAVAMLSKTTEAKGHPEYSAIDQLTTLIGDVALGKGKPHDANGLPFSDQLRLLTLVFEYVRDKICYKGEMFGEYVRWPWETIKTGGDCDCKVVLLATMLASLAFRRMHLLVLPPGAYLDMDQGEERMMQGHAMLEVDLHDSNTTIRVRLDPSCPDCDVDEIPKIIVPFIQNFYRIPILC